MYFGSVKFYRHLIIGTFCALMLASIIGCIVFGFKCSYYKSKYEQVLAANNSVNSQIVKVESKPSVHTEATSSSAPKYTKLYPDLYGKVNRKSPTKRQDKTVYLTFDDGPSEYTPEVLDILKKHNIKATFFVIGTQIGNNRVNTLQRIIDEGHAVGIHTYSHDYEDIYSSIDNYLKDFYKAYRLIYLQTGFKPSLFRFPGGSVNAYNKKIYKKLIPEMTRRRFVYFDWNISSGDAENSPSASSVKSHILNGIKTKSDSIVLMHDTKYATVSVLDEVITKLKEQNYIFKELSANTEPYTFSLSY